jgi:hypothetical protein
MAEGGIGVHLAMLQPFRKEGCHEQEKIALHRGAIHAMTWPDGSMLRREKG